jgi:hypothetical protein
VNQCRMVHAPMDHSCTMLLDLHLSLQSGLVTSQKATPASKKHASHQHAQLYEQCQKNTLTSRCRTPQYVLQSQDLTKIICCFFSTPTCLLPPSPTTVVITRTANLELDACISLPPFRTSSLPSFLPSFLPSASQTSRRYLVRYCMSTSTHLHCVYCGRRTPETTQAVICQIIMS